MRLVNRHYYVRTSEKLHQSVYFFFFFFFFFFFMFSIFQIMDDNTITLTFARTKKYGDSGSAKAGIALVSSIS